MSKDILKSKKEFLTLKKEAIVRIKTEKPEEGATASSTPSRGRSLNPAQTPPEPPEEKKSEAQKVYETLRAREKRREAIIRRNVERMIAKEKNERDVTVDEVEVPLFLNPMEAIYQEEKDEYPDDFPENVVKVKVVENETEVEKWFSVEDKEHREKRMVAWKRYLQTIKEIDLESYEFVEVGDVYNLHKAIMLYLNSNAITKKKKYLQQQYQKFSYPKEMLFKTFVAKYKQMRREMEQVGLDVDKDLLRVQINNLLLSSREEVKHTYNQILQMNSELDDEDPLRILEAMESQVERLECHRRENEKGTNDSPSDSEESEQQRKKREKRKEQRRKRAEKLKILKAQAARAAQPKNDDDDADVKGVCLFFNEDRCTHGDECKFKHTTLSKQKLEKLREWMRTRKEEKQSAGKSASGGHQARKCFNCGATDHVRAQCPKLATAKVREVRVVKKDMIEKAEFMSKKEREELVVSLIEMNTKE
jgi:hypothetical protein